MQDSEPSHPEAQTRIRLASLLHRFHSKTAWGVAVGPAGFHIHIGGVLPDPPRKPVGELSLWIQCRFHICSMDKFLLGLPAYPPEAENDRIAQHLENRVVTEADLDNQNALRMVLDDQLLFSAFPKGADERWIVYDHAASPVEYFIVHESKIEQRKEQTGAR